MFPAKGGIPNVSPRTLTTGIKLDYSKHCRLPFGSYVQVHDEPSPTNSPTARTVGAITLGPTGNLQGRYKFLNLWTGKKITRRNWTHLPMPSEVIERIKKLDQRRDNLNYSIFKIVMDTKKAIWIHILNHLITRSKEWSMLNTSRTTTLKITKTEMPISLIKVNKNKMQQ